MDSKIDSIKEFIHEIEDASDKMLGADHEDHLAKELLQDLLDRAMTEEEIQAIEDKYIKHFKEDEILHLIHEEKLKRGFVKD